MSADTNPGLALSDAEALISQYCYETTDYGDTSVFKTKRVLDMVRRAFEMGRTAQAASGERGWPKDAGDVRLFIGAHCESVQYGRHGPAPHEDDRYTLTAHDLLTAIRWWNDR